MVECECIYKVTCTILRTSFNRYMVECECTYDWHSQEDSKSFNRYMVECEFHFFQMWLTMRVVLIDTWWNVNFIRKSSNYKNGNGFNRYMVECE